MILILIAILVAVFGLWGAIGVILLGILTWLIYAWIRDEF